MYPKAKKEEVKEEDDKNCKYTQVIMVVEDDEMKGKTLEE